MVVDVQVQPMILHFELSASEQSKKGSKYMLNDPIQPGGERLKL